MNWLQTLLRRDDHDSKDRRLASLEARSDATVQRAERVVAEQKQLTQAVRNTVKALRAEHDRR